MARRLRNLVIRRVALVEEGANRLSDVVFFKRRDEGPGGDVGGVVPDGWPQWMKLPAGVTTEMLTRLDEPMKRLRKVLDAIDAAKAARTRKETDMPTKVEKRSTVEAELDKRVAKIRSASPSLTREQAETIVFKNEPSLFTRWLAASEDTTPRAAPAGAKAGTLGGVLDIVLERRGSELMKMHPSMSRAEAETKALSLDRDLETASLASPHVLASPVDDALAELASSDSAFADRVRTIVDEVA